MEIKHEVHTLIVWSKANNIRTKVKETIQSQFELNAVIDIQWDKNLFKDNLKVFYAHSQKHRSEAEYQTIIENKIKHCGEETFTLYVYKDLSPKYDFRITSSGNREVNVNIHDLKLQLRTESGGGHKIHASDNPFESNKDLTLLTGKNTIDFLKELEKIPKKEFQINKNCVGVEGYTSIQELFYVLNNSLNYCVVRNFECLPEAYNLAEHGDIDLLVEDLNYIKYLTLAKPYYPHLDCRVHYGILINAEKVPFDFRYLGDNYYDFNWESDILKTVERFKNHISVPNATHYFYSLLYHAYVQKRNIQEDYKIRLTAMAKALKIEYTAESNTAEIKQLLNEFLEKNKYQYTIPIDKTVFFNTSFINANSSREKLFGKLISTQHARLENEMLFTEVYDNGETITKFGSPMIIENESKALRKLECTGIVPLVLKTSFEENNCFVRMQKLPGLTLEKAQKDKRFWNPQNIKSMVAQLITLNKLLIENQILHRDIRPENIMVSFDSQENIHLKWIDFGWAIEFSNIKNERNPLGLGSKYKFAEGKYSDLFSTGKVINFVFKKFSFVPKLNKLFKIEPIYYSPEYALVLNEKVQQLQDFSFSLTFKDLLLCEILQRPQLLKILKYFKKVIKRKVKI